MKKVRRKAGRILLRKVRRKAGRILLKKVRRKAGRILLGTALLFAAAGSGRTARATEMGGFEVDVFPGENTEIPSGWNTDVLEEDGPSEGGDSQGRNPTGGGESPDREPSGGEGSQGREPTGGGESPGRNPSGGGESQGRNPTGGGESPDREPSGGGESQDQEPSGGEESPGRQPSGGEEPQEWAPSGSEESNKGNIYGEEDKNGQDQETAEGRSDAAAGITGRGEGRTDGRDDKAGGNDPALGDPLEERQPGGAAGNENAETAAGTGAGGGTGEKTSGEETARTAEEKKETMPAPVPVYFQSQPGNRTGKESAALQIYYYRRIFFGKFSGKLRLHSEGAVQILSVRINEKEISWRREGEFLIIDAGQEKEDPSGLLTEVLLFREDGREVSLSAD